MRGGSLFFLLGIVLFTQLPELPSVYLFALFPLCLPVVWRFPVLSYFLWGLGGFLWAFFCANSILSQQLTTEIEGEHLEVSGKIVSLPVVRKEVTRFELLPDSLVDREGHLWPVPGKIQLSWYRNAPQVKPGQVWRLQVKLKRPYGFMNPGGFDYEGWLFQQGIRATGYVLNDSGNALLEAEEGEYLHRLRFHLRHRLTQIFKESSNLALLLPLITGERGSLSSEHWQVLTTTGTNHLMAISGLHIGFIAFLAFWLARYIWPLGGRTSLVLASPYVSIVSAISCAVFYAGLAGFAIPTQRALIMVTVFLGLRFLRKQTSATYVVAIALFFVLLIDPFSVLSPGFWLSFTAFTVIVYGVSSRTHTRGLWWRWGRVQFLVAIGLLPMLVFWFQQIPLLSVVANMFAVPWVSIFTVPLALVGTILLSVSESAGIFILHLALTSLDLIWPVLRQIAGLEFTILPVAQPRGLVLGLAFVGVALLLMPNGLPGRYLGPIYLLPLFFQTPEKPTFGGLHLTVLDVGQGLATVVRTQNHLLLYDTGAKFNERFNAGSAVILPYLRHIGATGVDRLIISHGDNDHLGGFSGFKRGIKIHDILSSVSGEMESPRARSCENTQRWEWDGVIFEILHPALGSDLRGNNASCVLRIRTGRQRVLLTGDIESKAEDLLVKEYGSALAANILVAPHHGSSTSSSDAFLDAVEPEYTIFPVGYRNRFGFPKQDIMDRYKKRGVMQLQTASSGAIEFQISDSELSLTEYRLLNRRFWHTKY